MADEQALLAVEELKKRGVLTGDRYQAALELNRRGELTSDRLRQIINTGQQPQAEAAPLPPQEETAATLEGARPAQGFMGVRMGTRKVVDPEEAAAAERGVLTQGGAPAGRVMAGFAGKKEEDQIAALKNALTDHYRSQGYQGEVDVRKSPQGRLEFYNPEENKYQDVEGFDFTASDIPAAIPEAIPSITGVIGGLAAARRGGIPQIVGAEGGGGAAGQAFVDMMGMTMGLQDPTFREFAQSVGSRGAEEAVYSFGGAVGAKLLNRMVVGRAVPVDEAKYVLEKSKDTDELFQNLRDRGYKIEATPAQRANFETWLDQEATLRASADGARLSRQFEQMNTGNHAELSRFFNDMLAPSQTPVSRREVARTLAEQIADEGKKGVRKSKDVTEQLQEAMRSTVRELPELDEASAGRAIRGELPDMNAKQGGSGLLAARERANEVVQDKWAAVDRLAGRDALTESSKVKIPVDEEFKTIIEGMEKAQDSAILDMSRSKKGRLLGGMPSRLVKSENSIDILGPDGSILKSIDMDSKSMDFAALQTSLSDLKDWVRKAKRSTEVDAPSVRDANRLISAFTEARNKHLEATNPDLLAAVREAERTTREFHQKYSRSVVGDILRQESDGMVMRDRDVFNRVIAKNNPEEASEIAAILKGDAPTMRNIKQSISALYRQEATKDGVVNPTLHRKFMDQYGPTISQFLNADELARIEKTGNLADTIESSITSAAAREKAFKNSLQGRLDRMNTESMVDGIFSKSRSQGGSSFTITDVEDLNKWLGRQNPEMLMRVRDATADELSRKIRTPSGALSIAKLDKLLSDTGDLSLDGKLSALFGKQYAQDLKTLRDALEVTGRRGKPITQEGKGLSMMGLARRFFFPPLSQTGRRATVAQDLYVNYSRKSFSDALTNPDTLRRFVDMRDEAVSREKLAAVFAPALGTPQAKELADIIMNEVVPLEQENGIQTD